MHSIQNYKDEDVESSSLGQPCRRCRRLFAGFKGGYSYKKQFGSQRTQSKSFDQAITMTNTVQDSSFYLGEKSCMSVHLGKRLHGECVVYRGDIPFENRHSIEREYETDHHIHHYPVL